MTHYRWGALAFASTMVLAGHTWAQDAATQALSAEGMGQAIGESSSGGQSVFVTATARETLPTVLAGADMVDEAVWDRLGVKAIAAAQHEAQVLAGAAGREVGEAEQIMVLSKAVQGNAAIMTISVRYLLK